MVSVEIESFDSYVAIQLCSYNLKGLHKHDHLLILDSRIYNTQQLVLRIILNGAIKQITEIALVVILLHEVMDY